MQRLFHALDLAALGDWESAKLAVEDLDDPIVPRFLSLITEQQRREKERSRMLAIARHELGNALSIAQANVEAMVDGVLEPTVERLSDIRDALHTCGSLLVDLRKNTSPEATDDARTESFNICDLITHQAHLVSSIAESKNVGVASEPCAANDGSCTYRGDQQRISHAVRHVLLSAVRFTPPGGSVRIGCIHPNDEILLSVQNAAVSARTESVGLAVFSKLLQTVGGHARIVNDDPDSATFFISLPSVA
jgi:signal transduction histidine kinase